ncbi:MAG TPA: carbohydrate-binding protein [Cytophagales bacterium]|nr:carbohydrate-binding protein [Cytophagales bacterium]
MKSILRTSSFLILVFLISLSFSVQSQTYLKTEGKNIVNENGEPIILRGMGLGGWMLQEGYMLQMNSFANPQHQIRAKIAEVIGEAKTDEFYKAWLANHIRKIDIDSMASWGFNSIRLPMHYNLFTLPIEDEPVKGENTWLTAEGQGFAMVDSLLKWCQANQIYLILDLHAAPGGQGKDAAISDYDESKPSLWESADNQQKTVALWRKLAERYKDEPYVGGYDVINEPNWGFTNLAGDKNGCAETLNKPLKDLLVRIKDTIRAVDTKHIIFIEGNCWGNNHNGLWPFDDDNVVMSFHKYWNYNDKGSIQGMLNLRDQYDVPLWLGESGENSNTWFTNAIKLVEENNIGWAWWPVKKLGLNTPLEVKVNAGFKKLLTYWGNPTGVPKPSETESYNALMQLAEDIKFENNIYHKDVIDAMFRQVGSVETIPFKEYSVGADTIVFAVDFDMGRYGKAYSDKDTADYHIPAPPYQAWNQGWSYRNDGVDIEATSDSPSNGYSVGWIETDEWLQYTVNVDAEGVYDLKIRTAANNANGKIQISSNGIPITEVVSLPNTGATNVWQSTEIKDVYLKAGLNKLVIYMVNGGFNLNYLEFDGPRAATPGKQPKLLAVKSEENGKKISLTFNETFQPIPATHGFKVKVNETEAAITTVMLKAGAEQVILVELENPLTYGDFAFVSYSGTEVTTASGTVLDAISDTKVEVNVADPSTLKLIPGKLEAENMDVNVGLQTENTTDEGGGQNVGYTDPGDSFTFNATITETGTYNVEYRTSGQSATGKVELYVIDNGTPTLLDTKDLPSTGGWQTWKTYTTEGIALTEGAKQIQVKIIQGGFNINWLNFALVSVPESAPLRFISGETTEDGKKILMTFNQPISSASLANTGFTLIIDGQPKTAGTISLESANTLAMTVSDALADTSLIKVSYDGTGTVKSEQDDALEAFYNKLIKNNFVIKKKLAIPGRIEAEDFDKNSGFQLETTTDTGGGSNVGYTNTGDYLEYNVTVEKDGVYSVDYRIAAESATGKIKLLLIDGATVALDSVTFSATGGWQEWKSVSGKATLTAGEHKLRLLAQASDFNLNWVEFKFFSDIPSTPPTSIDNSLFGAIKVYPNPNNGQFKIDLTNLTHRPSRILLRDISSRNLLIIKPGIDSKVVEINEKLSRGLYLMVLEIKDQRIVHKLIIE